MVYHRSSTATSIEHVPLPSSLDGIDRTYTYSNRDAVAAYLERRPFLVPLLNETSTRIPRYFAPEDVSVLQVVWDRESLAEQLYVIVRTSLSPKVAAQRLDQLDEDWWLNALDAAQGALTIDVEAR